MIIDWFNSGIGKVYIVLDYSITIWTLLQFAELLLSDITIRLYYHYVCIVYLFKKSMNDVRWIVKFIMVEGVGRCLTNSVFILLGERGYKLGVWYLVQHFGDWGYKIHFLPYILSHYKIKSGSSSLSFASCFLPTNPLDNDFIRACIFLTPSKFFSLYFL